MATQDDWTTGQFPDQNDADSFTIGRAAPVKSVEQTEQEAAAREFRDIEPGEHLLTVAGFVKRPEIKSRSAFVEGQLIPYSIASVGVRLAKADDPQAQVVEWFDVLPDGSTEAEIEAYLYGSKNPDGKNAGFGAAKTFQFLGRLNPDWHVEPGQDLPDEALTLGNWKGRKVIATIEEGKPEIDPATQMPKADPTTGVPFKVRNRIKLFSFRAAVGGAAPAQPAPRPAVPAPHRPVQPPARQPVGAAPAARPGLRRSI